MDLTYLLLLQNLREVFGGVFDSYMLEITAMAESVPTFLLLAGIYWCVDKRTGQHMGWNTALACTWSQFLKAVCKIERPWVRDERIHPVEAAVPAATGYSFPSGHTARAVATWGTAGSCAWKNGNRHDGQDPKSRRQSQNLKWLGVLLWILTALILFSRNYLGVHTPQDVGMALLFGLGFMWVVERLLGWVEQHPRADLPVCAAGCLFCFLPMLRVGCIPNAGAGMGLVIGWLVERRLVQFETSGTIEQRSVRFLAGGALALFLLKTSSPVLGLVMEGKYAGFFAMFFFTFFVMAVYPYCFSRLEGQHTQEGRRKAGKLGAGAAGIFLSAVLVFSAVWAQRGQAGEYAQNSVGGYLRNGGADTDYCPQGVFRRVSGKYNDGFFRGAYSRRGLY
ncbi:MAG: phosphatase PAP2 family protein [Eubacterium sp.]|nr:phosphatase PAP2 family protein [Eubacterium sp.]